MNATADIPAVDSEDRLRADLYNYLGLILAGPPDQILLDQTAASVATKAISVRRFPGSRASRKPANRARWKANSTRFSSVWAR